MDTPLTQQTSKELLYIFKHGGERNLVRKKITPSDSSVDNTVNDIPNSRELWTTIYARRIKLEMEQDAKRQQFINEFNDTHRVTSLNNYHQCIKRFRTYNSYNNYCGWMLKEHVDKFRANGYKVTYDGPNKLPLHYSKFNDDLVRHWLYYVTAPRPMFGDLSNSGVFKAYGLERIWD